MPLRATDFESAVSTDSTTPAWAGLLAERGAEGQVELSPFLFQIRAAARGLDAHHLTHTCTMSYTVPMSHPFGSYVRERREALRTSDRRFSLRQIAMRVGVEPSYLSKVERGDVAPPSEKTIARLAAELSEDPDVMLALAGKVSSDLAEIIRKRPQLFGKMIRELSEMPDHAVLRVVREVRDGDW
jgi:HTH-type transcriptional regulator, competence development regulator